MSFLRKMLFFPSLAYNIAAEKITSRTWYNRIDENVILGALPFRSVLDTVTRTEGVKGVISFNEDYEVNSMWYPTIAEYNQLGVEFLRLPVQDYVATPTPEQVILGIEFIKKIIAQNGCVYIHCKAGRFRSAYFAAAYVIWKDGLDPVAAVEHVHDKRPQIWLGPKQMKSLQLYRNSLYPAESESGTDSPPKAPNVPEQPIP